MGNCKGRREVVLALLQVQFDLNKSERFIPCHKIHWTSPDTVCDKRTKQQMMDVTSKNRGLDKLMNTYSLRC